MANWLYKQTDADIGLMSRTLGVSENLALILAHRGIRSKNAAVKFLRPEMKFLNGINAMKDLNGACRLISQSIKDHEKIYVYGDYDADGVMSTVILVKTLRTFRADVHFYIPMREEEGYGLNMDAVRRMHSEGGRLIITCDNGIAALAEVDEAKALDMRTVIVDHHEPGFTADDEGDRADVIPDADCVVDPKQRGCAYAFKQYCAAGLCYRFAEAFYSFNGKAFENRDEFIVLAAFATVCDIVPIMEENRILVRAGLDILKRDKKINTGLWSLMKAKNIHEKVIGVFDIGFLLGPCVNASGRLASAADAVTLFLSDDSAQTEALAQALAALNEQRKEMTAKAVELALGALSGQELDKVLVLYNEGIHESIAGIVAGRIKESVCRPVIMLTGSDGMAKGSARSIEGYNIFEALYENRGLFTRFGGHSMAAGLTMPPENIGLLRRRLNEDCSLTEKDFTPVLYLEYELQPEKATFELARELELLAPYGRDNPEPLFGAKGMKPEQLRMINDKNTMIFTFGVAGANRKIRGVCFGLNDAFRGQIEGIYDAYDSGKILGGVLRSADFLMDVVYALEINEYNNNVSVQMRIKDFHIYRGQG